MLAREISTSVVGHLDTETRNLGWHNWAQPECQRDMFMLKQRGPTVSMKIL
jgi:hypothetical protein